MRKKINWKRIVAPLLLILILFLTEPSGTSSPPSSTHSGHRHEWGTSEHSCNLLVCKTCGDTYFSFTGMHDLKKVNCWVFACTKCAHLSFPRTTLLHGGGHHNYDKSGYNHPPGGAVCQDCGWVYPTLDSCFHSTRQCTSQYCDECGRNAPFATVVHNYKNGSCTEPAVCKDCGATALRHGHTGAVLGAFALCSDCNQIVIKGTIFDAIGTVLGAILAVIFILGCLTFVMILPITMTVVFIYMIRAWLRNRPRRRKG